MSTAKPLYTTGNEERDEYLIRAIRFVESVKEAPTLQRVALRLDGIAKLEGREPFDLLQRELDGMLGTLHPLDAVTFDDSEQHSADLPFDPVSAATIRPRQIARVSESLEKIEAPRANGGAPSSDSAPEATPQPVAQREVTRDDAVRALNAANAELTEARNTVRRRAAELQAARAKVAAAINQWQIGTSHQALTPEQNARNFALGALEERKRRAALYGTGTSATANAFVKRQRMVPPGVDPSALRKGGNRGAFPSSARMLAPRKPTAPPAELIEKMGVAPKV